MEEAGIWVAAILTLMVYSYLIADNPLFRLAEHILIGTALGYAALIILQRFLVPSVSLVLSSDATSSTRLMIGLGLLWGGFLWLWLARPVRWVASWSLAIVTGVGAALAVGGALTGTLIPQVGATILPLVGENWLDNLVTVVVVIAGLTYFFFTIDRERPLGRVVGRVAQFGRWCLMVALGVLLGARVITLLSAVVERFQFLSRWLQTILS